MKSGQPSPAALGVEGGGDIGENLEWKMTTQAWSAIVVYTMCVCVCVYSGAISLDF